MGDKANRKTGSEPEKRGYQPKPTDRETKPPKGGTGETVIQQDQSSGNSDDGSDSSYNSD